SRRNRHALGDGRHQAQPRQRHVAARYRHGRDVDGDDRAQHGGRLEGRRHPLPRPLRVRHRAQHDLGRTAADSGAVLRARQAAQEHDSRVTPSSHFQLVARTGHPSFLDLPWNEPLEEWDSPRFVNLIRGISRHVVRFVEYDGVLYALKELPERPARREWTLLRRLEGQALPVVEPVGIVTDRGDDLDAILITRHLEYSLPYRALFSGAAIPDLRTHLLNGLVELLARLHLRGFFWGDCSLSNTLFRRDLGGLSAYLVDAETGELHGQVSDGQRAYDLDIAQTNIVGELLDVDAEVGLPPDLDPDETGEEIVRRYTSLWHEMTREETFGPEERFKLDERLHSLNDLGFDVEEIQLEATPSGY